MEKKKFLIMLSAIVAAAGVGIGGFTIVRSVRKSNFSPAPKLENTHVHNYVAEVIPATCAQGGYTLYSCDCGDFHKENETEALEHNWGEWIVIQPATVETEGTKEQRCISCNERKTEAIPRAEAHEHTYEDKSVAPTCTTKGFSARTCTVCGLQTIKDSVDALGHSWTAWKETKAATTSAAGEKTRTCKTCKTTETCAIPKIGTPEHTHSYVVSTVEATCTSGGYTRHTCSSCGDYYDDNITTARGHLYGDWQVTVQATTSSTGERACSCTRCGHAITETVPKLDAATAEKYESYIDPKITIQTSPNGAIRYYYYPVAVIDTRSWGTPPTIYITSDGGFYVSYYKQDGSKVEWNLPPIEGYVNSMVIWESGSFSTQLTGDYSD